MNNIERYNKTFTSTFKVDESNLNSDFKVDSIAEWDSVTQLSLVTEIEDEFDIMLDSEDILEFTSYEHGKKILSKYDISI